MLKNFLALVLVVAVTTNAPAFSLLGPPPSGGAAPDGYQEPVIGYHLGGDIGGPKNLGEEYRWNTPILNYAMDANYFDYFGSNGVVAIEQAIAILNGVSNLSSYTASMNELPLEAARVNYQAQALRLVDLKSMALTFVVEELGLADPDRYTWSLRDRRPIPGASCPNMLYDVIKRNFDPETFQPTSYVNGTLYSYRIIEFCSGVPNPLADAVEFPVDPLAQTATSVASFGTGLLRGGFWTGLTRDDIGGLRYMLRTNNINFESVSTGSILLQTNSTAPELLTTSDLSILVAQSITNNAGTLSVLFPGLQIASTVQYFTNLVTTNVTASFQNYQWDPVGTPPHLVLSTTLTTNVATWFRHTFANVITNPNTFSTNGALTVQTIQVVPAPFAPVGSGILQTNVSQTTSIVPRVTGSYYLLQANECEPQIISTQLTTIVSTTNITVSSTNASGDGQSFTQSTVSYFTNRTFVVNPCDRLTGTVGLRRGMDRFTFVRQNYDSLLGRFFQPVTNRYSLVGITNSTTVIQTFERVITRPDFLFSSEERMVPDLAWLSQGFRTIPGRGNGFVTANILNPDAVDGPGTREPFIEITFNRVGPLLQNVGPGSLLEASALTNFVWASYDASTNAPIIYPSGTSITDLENQILIQVSPATLLVGTAGLAYSSQFTVVGGQPPYTFSWFAGATSLPAGLTLTNTGMTAMITGTPSTSGVFDVVVRVADSSARVVDRSYTITINP